MSIVIGFAATVGIVVAVYFLLAFMWWQADAPCSRCGKKHWDFDHRMRCLNRYRRGEQP